MAFLLNVGLNVISLLILPETVAMHFGRGGKPDAWATREAHVFWMIVTDVITFVPFYWAPELLDRMPSRLISLPYKTYWLQEKNREQAKRMFARLMDEFGLVLFGFLFGITLMALDANRSTPVALNERLFFVLFAGFMGYTLVWVIRLVVRFRPPGRN
jgi:hypothetical protein